MKCLLELIKFIGNKYDYSNVEFEVQTDKVDIICSVHGVFKQAVDRHLQGHGCKLCSSSLTGAKRSLGLSTFIEKANIKHNYEYDYSLIKEYKNNITKYNIVCRKHGSFLQTAADHLYGQGCPICAVDKRGAYSRTKYIESNKNKLCTFYILHCFNDKESFYKIGITNSSVKRRYKDDKKMPYNYTIIKEIKASAEYVWDKELELKQTLKSKYLPLISFAGSLTECYSDKEEILSI